MMRDQQKQLFTTFLAKIIRGDYLKILFYQQDNKINFLNFGQKLCSLKAPENFTECALNNFLSRYKVKPSNS